MGRRLLASAMLAVLMTVSGLPLAQADATSLAGKVIALDAGHGGDDPGGSGLGLVEKVVTLDVAERAQALLEAEGATVLMTRDCDCTVSLQQRVDVANHGGAHRFLSVHANNCGGCGGKGTESYYHSSLTGASTAAGLARVLQEETVSHLQTSDRGVKQADLFVLRKTAMPAVVVELAFLDEASDNAKLASAAWRQEAARAILHAVQRDFGVAPHDPAPPADDLAGRKIALDAGHGGDDPGGVVAGLQEKAVNLDVVQRAKVLLEAMGATVFLTRDCDCTVSLQQRVDVANNNDVDPFLSVHANNCGGCGGKGTETYYHSSLTGASTAAGLARALQEETVSHLQTSDRGVKQADFFVLRKTSMPAALVELGFLDDAGDAAKLGSAAWRQEAARAILHAVQRHFGLEPEDPPAAFEVTIASPSAGGWLRGDVLARGTTNQEASLSWMRFLVDGQVAKWVTPAPHEWTWDTRAHPDGARKLALEGRSTAGETAKDEVVVKVDNTPPATTHAAAGTAGDGGWLRSDATVTLACSDAASGCDATAYALGGAASKAYAGPFAVAGDGVHALTYASTDEAGNAEAARAREVRIDRVAPATQAGLDGTAGDGGWWRSAVRVTLACSDATSGCAATTYDLGGAAPRAYEAPFQVHGDGAHALALRSRDRAGNVEPDQQVGVRIDATAPATAVRLDGTAGWNGWWRSDVAVTLACADATSGCAETLVSLDDGPFLPYGGPFAVRGDGEHSLVVRSRDRAGNLEPAQATRVRIDTTPPMVSVFDPERGGLYAQDRKAPLAAPLPATLLVGDKTLEAFAADATSGVGFVVFLVDGVDRGSDATAPYQHAWRASAERAGEHLLAMRAYDAAGNSAEASLVVHTVPTAPEGVLATLPAKP